MLQDALARLEQRVAARAPELLDDVRQVATAATLESLVWSVGAAGPRGDTTLVDALPEADDEPGTSDATALPSAGGARYLDLGLIGVGGMGEVRRVRDLSLHRVVAMKQVRLDLAVSAAALARFVEEVRTTAQLQHPGIVPVYDAGRTAEGSVWFTMKEVRGRTLTEVVREVHETSVEQWETTPNGWSLRRLVTALHQASQAVGYAHDRGVVHRDLKPDNVMLGAFGEVQVMDWGLSKVRGRAEGATEQVVVEPSREATRTGRVMGTPAYMAPEQARGDLGAVDERTDVYALGTMLYQVLTGRPPYSGATGLEVVRRVLEGPPSPPSRASRSVSVAPEPSANSARRRGEGPAPLSEAGAGGELELPEELVAACERAMARERGDRYPSAAAFADDLQAWLDGSRKREQALEVVARAEAIVPDVVALLERAAALRAEAEAELAVIPGWASEEEKLAGWAKQDEAAALESSASLESLERDQLLAASLTWVPELPEAHATLAEDQRARHRAAETARDAAGARRAEVLLRSHVDALPGKHPVAQRCAAYLRGTGAVTVVTDPEGAEVELFRYEPYGRRLVAVPVRALGRTPLVEHPLERGSYLLLLRHPERATVRYPVRIERGAHWDGVRPGSRDPLPVELPHASALGSDDRYVPAGWFQAGGRGEQALTPGTQLWCDAFVMRRFPVTNREYLAYLDDLVARGLEEEALRRAPRERASSGDDGAVIYGRDSDGRFVIRPDADGDVWDPDFPVVMVDWHRATTYARWLAERTGQGWRLPWDLEWEKAARGVDGRFMPWGDSIDPSFCNVRQSHRGRALPKVVDSFPLDESVYGVRGLGGNVEDWCLDVRAKAGVPIPGVVVAPFEDEGGEPGRAERVRRGGYCFGLAGYAMSTHRNGHPPGSRAAGLGFRVARPWPSVLRPTLPQGP